MSLTFTEKYKLCLYDDDYEIQDSQKLPVPDDLGIQRVIKIYCLSINPLSRYYKNPVLLFGLNATQNKAFKNRQGDLDKECRNKMDLEVDSDMH